MATTGKKAILTALFANLGIAIAKFLGFFVTQSSSMLAEGVHSMADSANQSLLLLGSKRAKRAPTDKHPFGYGRERYFWSFLVSLVLFSMGSLFAIYEGIKKLRHPHEVNNISWAIGILCFGIVLEAISFRIAVAEANTIREGKSWPKFILRSKQPEIPLVLLEDAGALIGLVVALTAVSLAKFTEEARWDGAGTLTIGILLGLIAVFLAKEMHSLLIGESVVESDRLKIIESIESSEHVEELVKLRTQHLAPDEILIGAQVLFKENLTIKETSAVINELEAQIRKNLPEAGPIFIDPETENF